MNLDSLDPQQKKAVLINDGSLLIFAGAGSGKTRVITTKIAWQIENGMAKPWEILAVTFTNKACNEMRERVASLVGEDLAKECVIRTFHSFGVWLLRRYGERVGLNPNFTIYDDKESAALLHQCFPTVDRREIDQAIKKISALKDRMQKPARYDSKLCEFYDAYENKLRETGNVDFADMILKSNQLLLENEDVRQFIHKRFKTILVDEYQDSNTAQFKLLSLLAGPSTFVCVVGDDDQSIYRFRGAEVENILNFSKHFQNTQTVVLGKNYRCTEQILSVARDVISNNRKRVDKDLVADNTDGSKPRLYYVNTEFDEAQQVVDIVKQMSPSEQNSTAVLYRTNAQSKAFEDRFMMNGVPYRIVGSLRFYDREEVRDSISLIGLVANPYDSVAFERMINKPTRGIGPATVQKIVEHGSNVVESSRDLVSSALVKGKAADGIRIFLNAYDRCVSQIGKLGNGELLNLMLTEFGLMDYYKKRDEEEKSADSSRVESLNQLVNMLYSPSFSDGLEGIHAFLEYAALDPSSLGTPEGQANRGVTLITMHNTKGLEFDTVFVTGLEDEIFPSLRIDSSNDDLEEERRICYVAMTRARKNLYLLSASSRMVWGRFSRETPSRFLSEIDAKHISVVDRRFNQRPASNFYTNSYSNTYTKRSSFSYDKYDSYEPKKPVLIKKKNEDAPRPVITDWKAGDRVKHPVMGEGTVTQIKKFGNRDVLVISFDDGRTGSFIPEKTDFIRTGQKTE